MPIHGSCHCGKIAYRLDAEPTAAIECNCSICRRKGVLMAFYPVAKLKVEQGEAALKGYQFNTHKLTHWFCPTCGIHPFAEAADKTGKPMAAINVRVLEGVDPKSFPVKPFNGRAL